jgi:hypothetical protein
MDRENKQIELSVTGWSVDHHTPLSSESQAIRIGVRHQSFCAA